MPVFDARAELADALAALGSWVSVARPSTIATTVFGDSIVDRLAKMAHQAEDQYARIQPASGDTPTPAQGLTLARLLRSRLCNPSDHVTVSLGDVLELPDGYIALRFSDGSESGIDRDGVVTDHTNNTTLPAVPARSNATLPQARELADSLAALAMSLSSTSSSTRATTVFRDSIADRFAELAHQAEDQYARIHPASGETPTPAQGLTLARLLRSRLRNPSDSATVSLGDVFALPDGYIAVRFSDGFEAGVDRDGVASS